MAIRSPKKPFSKRFGYRSQPKEITVWEDAPEALRCFILETARELGMEPHDLREAACYVLHRRPDPGNWSAYPNVWGEVQDLIYGCDWYKIYDFAERLYHDLGEQRSGEYPLNQGMERQKNFQEALNEFLLDEGIGWQMIQGEIMTRGTETFESNVNRAVEALEAAGRATARDETHKALMCLSQRPRADLTGAVQHAMAALECVARDVAGDPKATLGDILKRYRNLIPKPLDTSVEKAWGYASQMGRHIQEGREPERKEVELIVGLSATIATYLSR